MLGPSQKKRKTDAQEKEQSYVCIPIEMVEGWLEGGSKVWSKLSSSGAGSSDSRDMDNMSTLSASWIAVKRDDVEDGQDLEWMDVEDGQGLNEDDGQEPNDS